MSSTTIKSSRKSKNLPENFDTLNAPGQEAKDFWEFYKDNKDSVDYIIRSQIHNFLSHELSEQELLNEILVRLYDSCVLANYNRNSSLLSSYLTKRVWGYVRNIVRDKKREDGTWKPYPSKPKITNGDSSDQYNSFVHLSPTLSEYLESESMEDQICFKDLMEKSMANLPESYHRILKRLNEGYSLREITQELVVPRSYITPKVEIIKRVVKRLLTKE